MQALYDGRRLQMEGDHLSHVLGLKPDHEH